jgi:two-component system chemotaxis response regulator CheB
MNEAPHRGSRRGTINVLVVDDSAIVRQVMTNVLGKERDLQVTTAPDPLIALKKMQKLMPDVIVLDLEMPRMDGLTFLHKVMQENPIPVVICSGHAGRGSDNAIKALEEGAVEIVNKPRVGIQEFLYESSVLLSDTVRAAAQAKVRQRKPIARPQQTRLTADAVLPPLDRAAPTHDRTDKVVAIGASTGGTEAIKVLLEAMPATAPGMVIVQHMPEGFTAAFARRIDSHCAIEVREAKNNDRVEQGLALIAPGNQHLLVHRSGNRYRVEVTGGPLVSRHRPSVDVLFRSVARCAGSNSIGVIMTGMGDDGAEGLEEMHNAGAATIAQNEASCVVFGMPKEAIARGAVDTIAPLPMLSSIILRKV